MKFIESKFLLTLYENFLVSTNCSRLEKSAVFFYISHHKQRENSLLEYNNLC